MPGLHGIQGASFCRIGLKASVRSRRLTTIGLSRRFLAGSQAAADNHESETHVVLFTAGFFGRGFDSRRLHQICLRLRRGIYFRIPQAPSETALEAPAIRDYRRLRHHSFAGALPNAAMESIQL